MTETSLVLQHAITKVRRLPGPPADGPGAWVALRPFPPGLQPSFLGAMVFWHDGRAETRLPALNLFALDHGDRPSAAPMRYINLFHDPVLGGAALLDDGPGWRRIDFAFSLPPDHPGAGVRALARQPGAEAELAIDAGILAPEFGVWRFTPAAAAAAPPSAGAQAAGTPPLRPGFVGGAPKSGTTWMQILLNQHPQVMASGEGSLLYNATVRDNQSVNRWLAPGMAQAALNEMANHALLLRMFNTYREHTGCAWVIDKTPGNARFYRRLLAYAPRARLIHCVRHPLDVVVSRLHHEANFIANGRVSGEMKQHEPALRPLPGLLAAGGALPLEGGLWAVAEAVLGEYAAAQREALETARERPGRLLIVRYEDMLADTQACALLVFAHLGVPATPEQAAACARNASFGNLLDKRQGRAHSFFRSGTEGQYPALFTPADQARAMAHLRGRLPTLGDLGYGP